MTKFFNLDNPAPYVSARSWCIFNIDTGELMFAKREKEVRQVASLTKIMTFRVVSELLITYALDPDSVKVKTLVTSCQPLLCGTSAQLLPDDSLSVTELLYGMMLPSGNDAAQTLAIYFGEILLLADKGKDPS
jgi:serine-type D-Ala-D-Ala carboxypeptidase (penicillin-binding protein 5/6)